MRLHLWSGGIREDAHFHRQSQRRRSGHTNDKIDFQTDQARRIGRGRLELQSANGSRGTIDPRQKGSARQCLHQRKVESHYSSKKWRRSNFFRPLLCAQKKHQVIPIAFPHHNRHGGNKGRWGKEVRRHMHIRLSWLLKIRHNKHNKVRFISFAFTSTLRRQIDDVHQLLVVQPPDPHHLHAWRTNLCPERKHPRSSTHGVSWKGNPHHDNCDRVSKQVAGGSDQELSGFRSKAKSCSQMTAPKPLSLTLIYYKSKNNHLIDKGKWLKETAQALLEEACKFWAHMQPYYNVIYI